MTEKPTPVDLSRDLKADLNLARSMHQKGLLSDWHLEALAAAVRRALWAEEATAQVAREEAMRDD